MENTNDDLIYRQAVNKIIDNLLENDNLQASPSVWHGLHMIKQLPSAQPETPSYVAEIESEYKKWVSMPHINKPLAKALYEVWKKHDREDVSRNG